MKYEIEFFVPGNPQSLKRHRTRVIKAGDRTFATQYDPSSKDKNDFLAKCLQHRPSFPYKDPLFLDLIFIFPRPKNHFGTGRNAEKLKDHAPVWHTKPPDLDNLLKFVCDALNGVFWHDDRIISETRIRKTYGKQPGVIIRVNPHFNQTL